MRRALVVGIFGVFLLFAAGGSAASGAGSTAGATGGWANGLEAVLPVDGIGASLSSVSCASAGNCTAVGTSYGDKSSDGLLLSETGGVWAAGVKAQLPAGWTGGDLTSVSCASAGNCTAVGYGGLLLSETGGVWATGVKAALPADAQSGTVTELKSVSCASPGNCSAVGSYWATGNRREGLLLTESDGVWATGVAAVLPPDTDPNVPYAVINAVSCASPGNCSAVGTYNWKEGMHMATTFRGVLLTETDGSWGAGVESVLPPDGKPDSVYLTSISCASPGDCGAVGYYLSAAANQNEGLLLTETAGVWGTGVKAGLPEDAVSGSFALVNSVSCPAAGNCTAIGEYYNGAFYAPVLLTETAGEWETGVGAEGIYAPVPGRGGLGGPVSCSSVGNCSAVAVVGGATFLLTETAGQWSSAVLASLPANYSDTYNGTRLVSISCPSAGECGAVGTYFDQAGNMQGLLLDSGPGIPRSTLTVTTSGTGSGSVDSLPNGLHCGAVDTSVCAFGFRTGTEVTLTPVAGDNSTFLGWSGGSCSGTGDCTVTVDAETTVNAEFALIPHNTLTVTTSGTGSGGVYSLPNGIHCGLSDLTVCAFAFQTGTAVTLKPVVGSDATFLGWSGGGCSGTGDCKVTVNADTTVNAEFALRPCLVPKLKGQTLTAAKRSIGLHDCTVGKVKRAPSRTIRKGRVISQSPKVGKRMAHGAKIDLTVSTGR